MSIRAAHRLLVLQRLPADLCSVKLVEALQDTTKVSDVIKCVDLLVAYGVSRNELVDALKQVSSANALVNCWQRWTRRASFPVHPVPPSPFYRPILTATELARVARKYRNCVERYITTILEGVDHFAEFEWKNRLAVVHLRKTSGIWYFEDAFGKLNCRPRAELREALAEYLALHGIRSKERQRAHQSDWHILRRLSHSPMFDLDDF